jgi:hypothetical protein
LLPSVRFQIAAFVAPECPNGVLLLFLDILNAYLHSGKGEAVNGWRLHVSIPIIDPHTLRWKSMIVIH